MGRMGYGYGSEWHLLRFLGRHRQSLDRRVFQEIGRGERIEWVDSHFAAESPLRDAERKGLDFLDSHPEIQAQWREWWPQGRGIPNWDAVGWLIEGTTKELLLVEAKANVEELQSNCGAKDPNSLKKITAALMETQRALGMPYARNWLRGCYQMANRLALLHFLNSRGIPTHLVLIYFTGDRGSRKPKRTCPSSRQEWLRPLAEQEVALAVGSNHPLESRVQSIFLSVDGT